MFNITQSIYANNHIPISNKKWIEIYNEFEVIWNHIYKMAFYLYSKDTIFQWLKDTVLSIACDFMLYKSKTQTCTHIIMTKTPLKISDQTFKYTSIWETIS